MKNEGATAARARFSVKVRFRRFHLHFTAFPETKGRCGSFVLFFRFFSFLCLVGILKLMARKKQKTAIWDLDVEDVRIYPLSCRTGSSMSNAMFSIM